MGLIVLSSASPAGKLSDPWRALSSSWHETGERLMVVAWKDGRILLLFLWQSFLEVPGWWSPRNHGVLTLVHGS